MEHSYGGRVSYRGLISTHPVNIPGGRKQGYPEKTTMFRRALID
jgi:hypothetical protein